MNEKNIEALDTKYCFVYKNETKDDLKEAQQNLETAMFYLQKASSKITHHFGTHNKKLLTTSKVNVKQLIDSLKKDM